jgi:DegV family protein with EDD domain
MMVLDTLEYLQRGGRIGRARAWFGGMLNIKPVLAVREGEVVPVERVRSRARAEERLFELVGENPRRERLGIWHSGSDEDGERWAERLRALLPGVPVEVGLLGPVVGVYGGPQTLGIAMLNRADGA